MKKLFVLFAIVMFVSGCSNNSVGKTDKKDTIVYSHLKRSFIENNYNSTLHYLDLSKKGLTGSIDFASILSGSRLKYDVWYVDMSLNQIKSVGNEFSFFPNLKELNLSYNKLDLFGLTGTHIEKLYLHKNKLSYIDLSSLKELKEVNLGYNQFKGFENIKLPKDIYSIGLQHNKLENLNGLEQLKKWKILKLEFNNLSNDLVKKLEKIDSFSGYNISYKYQQK